MHQIVVDLGFGDSGKGAITDRLAAQDPDYTAVIRYTGGSQAGHNVVVGDQSHIHSSFASGALGGSYSHMSRFCPISPQALVEEALVLEPKTSKLRGRCSLDPLCPIITPYDIMWNMKQSLGKKNTVGLGVGATMRRHLTSPHRIFAADLMNKPLYRQKLQNVRAWYGQSLDDVAWDRLNPEIDFEIFDWVYLVPTWTVVSMFKTLVFEGAQGIMLDQDHGFFPNVTYGHTTIQNAMSLLPAGQEATIQYVTRSYQTRHGDGPMGLGETLEGLPDETNHERGHQGEFRTAKLDFEMLSYAFMVNEGYADTRIAERVLNVTCCDRLEPDFDALKKIFPIGKRYAFHGADRLVLGAEF